MPPPIHPQREDLEEIAETVFSTMLGLAFQEQTSLRPCQPAPGALTAAIGLEGSWQGTVLLQCLEAQAREFTARYLGTEPPDKVNDDVRDVLGELANMIAGNLKCTLGPGIRMSCPRVVEGPAGSLTITGTVICELSFETEGGPFWVSAVESLN